MRAGDAAGAVELLKGLMREAGLRYPEGQMEAFGIYLVGRARRPFTRFPTRERARSEPQRERLATLAAVYAELWLVDPLRALAVHAWFFEEASHAQDHYWLQALTWELAHLAVMHGPRALPRMTRLLSAIDAFALERGSPYDRAVAKMARAVSLIHAHYRPREALELISEADQLFTTQCSGVHFERSWLALSRDFALEAMGDFVALTASVLERARDTDPREDGYTWKQLLFTYPTVMLAQDRPEAALSFLQQRWGASDDLANVVDFAAIMRGACALLYAGDASASFGLLERHWPWLSHSGVFRSGPMRAQGDFHRARAAAALYWQSGDRRWKQDAERHNRKAEPALERAYNRLIAASLAWADSRLEICRRSLEEALDSLELAQDCTGAWAVRYRLAQLTGSRAELEAAERWMREHGICNPERWLVLFVPGPDSRPPLPSPSRA